MTATAWPMTFDPESIPWPVAHVLRTVAASVERDGYFGWEHRAEARCRKALCLMGCGDEYITGALAFFWDLDSMRAYCRPFGERMDV